MRHSALYAASTVRPQLGKGIRLRRRRRRQGLDRHLGPAWTGCAPIGSFVSERAPAVGRFMAPMAPPKSLISQTSGRSYPGGRLGLGAGVSPAMLRTRRTRCDLSRGLLRVLATERSNQSDERRELYHPGFRRQGRTRAGGARLQPRYDSIAALSSPLKRRRGRFPVPEAPTAHGPAPTSSETMAPRTGLLPQYPGKGAALV